MSGQNRIDQAPGGHIRLRDDIAPAVFDLLVQMCPAGLYWRDEDGFHYDSGGCLECGVCRSIAGEENFLEWNFPEGGKGVDYTRP